MRIIEQLESEVRGYVRSFPVVFDTAKGSYLYDEQGNEYIDFFSGAGTLNYGHNNPIISKALLKYIERDGIIHGLDKATVAKVAFLQKFYDTILSPRNFEYKVQFTGPTGTNATETALKLARMIKRRSNVIAFTNGYHGLTMGSLAVTGNTFYRDESYGIRNNSAFMPYDGYFGPDVDTIEYFRRFLEDSSSGVDLPAAVILETVQAEGGINVASDEWLRRLERLCREFDILLIVDDIQVGNGRTGTFFSFERAGITPDMVTLSKSIGGGLPLSLLLMRPELDQWKPGEHTGTFRGNNLAFVAAVESLSAYWENDDLTEAVKYKGEIIETELKAIAKKYPELNGKVRGVGMIWGLEMPRNGFTSEVSKEAFENGVIIEIAGADDQVLKFLPSLTIEETILREGLGIIDQAIGNLLTRKREKRSGNTQQLATEAV
ncbi:diaminobutyrate--2-oxoglutarate transaminase [Nitrosococcus oceani]|uniref:Diaminobutyrate--2-oxoglutarate transaminase n=2 Tax=Nitrosococcus oceani TaxID=1229 RepID=Q3JAV3_NITOC|nr:diaminobutyrate--2-oxoglutarate transaminase [Nitrosococcus oceani]KFI19514.1 diaminobutyrate--2-oxoglutarate aminotransferase [Nitrosococcus oceani C-27]ABA58043.1 diaminobutyrate aminotransferase apoenzyme [Nitrosococcus oceani ATCC 19707]EDZ67711.1 diaminobutyrate--2-oxoglutarate aminotransferase [Nitrosococcus oceani AFC27]KFI22788.1 diaminobutyrate--2-oxoglutarate aminotransferase [Nitrosococcus oceani]GEM20995.1 diaminobutyrate--2-oxoglutarate transaminase [Nitrosococcus oceani]